MRSRRIGVRPDRYRAPLVRVTLTGARVHVALPHGTAARRQRAGATERRTAGGVGGGTLGGPRLDVLLAGLGARRVLGAPLARDRVDEDDAACRRKGRQAGRDGAAERARGRGGKRPRAAGKGGSGGAARGASGACGGSGPSSSPSPWHRTAHRQRAGARERRTDLGALGGERLVGFLTGLGQDGAQRALGAVLARDGST